MAFALKSLSLTFLLLLILLQLSDGLNDAQQIITSFKGTSNRKLLMVNIGLKANEAEVFKIHVKKMGSRKEDNIEEGWELRAAPLGPDPLHHHGSDPKKPRTP